MRPGSWREGREGGVPGHFGVGGRPYVCFVYYEGGIRSGGGDRRENDEAPRGVVPKQNRGVRVRSGWGFKPALRNAWDQMWPSEWWVTVRRGLEERVYAATQHCK